MLTDKYTTGHEGDKLVTKSYAYEVDPTVEITHHRSSEKKHLTKKSVQSSEQTYSYQQERERHQWGKGSFKYQSVTHGGASGAGGLHAIEESKTKTFSKKYVAKEGEIPSYMRGTAIHQSFTGETSP